MQITEATSQKIKNMSLLCAAFVVMIHMGLPGGRETSTWLLSQLKFGICGIAVPFFFVVSGFFLAAHFNETGWWGREVKKRISSLVIPFFLWSFISVLFSAPISIMANLASHRPFYENCALFYLPDWPCILGIDLTASPFHYQLWYVRCLFIFIILAPLILKLINKFQYIWLLICFSIILFQNQLPIPEGNEFFRYGFSPSGLFYFSLGIYIHRHQSPNINPKMALFSAIMGISLLAIKTLYFYFRWTCPFNLGALPTPLLLVALWYVIPTKKLSEWLVSCAFPIFLMHTLCIPYINTALKITRLTQVSPILRPTINFLVGFFGSILVATLLRKYLPKTAKVLFGGR